jgi:hypothetical protein
MAAEEPPELIEGFVEPHSSKAARSLYSPSRHASPAGVR